MRNIERLIFILAALLAAPLAQADVWRVFQQTGPGTILPSVSPLPATRDVDRHLLDIPASQPPAADWAAPDFDDQRWLIVDNVAQERTGGSSDASAVIYFRTNFGVAHPVKNLRLALQYRGGVTVFVNGREIGRAEAKEYPVEAFALEAKPSPALVALRTRAADFPLPAMVLRPGRNVLAIQNTRAAYRMEGVVGDRFLVGTAKWPTVGLVSAQLLADTGLVNPPPARIWNAGMLERESSIGDALAELKPVPMYGPRGGSAWGQVMVAGQGPLSAGPVSLGGLPVEVRFAANKALQVVAPTNAVVPVWFTVAIPATAKPGKYDGQVTLRGQPVKLSLEVFDWVLPEAKQWKSWALTFQSPETLAAQYKVPLWSEAHFALIEQSLAYQARLGQKVAVVHAINGALLARQTMVLYRQEGGRVVPDFSAVSRYLALFNKHMGCPEAVALVVWDANVSKTDTPLPVTRRDDSGLKEATFPHFGQPGSEELWPAVVSGLQAEMKKWGWPIERLMLGLTQDGNTKDSDTAFFAKHFPHLKWITYTHGTRPAAPLQLGIMINPGQGGGHSSGHGWRTPRGYPNITNLRGHLEEPTTPFNHRVAAMVALAEGFNGPGGFGLDYWEVPVMGRNGRVQMQSVFQSGPDYTAWFRIIRGTPRTLLAPGEKGPISTVSYENMLAGFQEAQALIYVDDNAKNPKLPADVAKRAGEMYNRLQAQGDLRNWRQGAGHGWEDQIVRLYRTAAEIQGALGP